MNLRLTAIPALLALSIMLVRTPHANAREEHGGGAPHAEAPHVAAPHMAAPHMAAPHMAAPHMAAPHVEARHIAAPHVTASHAVAPHPAHHEAPHATPHAAPHAASHAAPHASAHAEATHEKAAPHESAKHESAHETKPAAEHEGAAQHNPAEAKHAEEEKSAKEAAGGHQGEKSAAHGEESAAHGNAASEGNKEGHGALSGAHAFANPRKVPPVKPGSKPQFTSAKPGALSYKSGANNIPHAGGKGKGKAGIFDPGGYVRSGKSSSPPFDRNHIQQQLSSIPNYQRNFSSNERARISDRSHWPHQWNPGPQGSGLGYYPGYFWNGTNYPYNYYSLPGYCPTPFLFLLESGAFWQPGAGYAYGLPYGYNQPMSIGVNEVVPEYDAYGNIIGYVNQRFYYNAIWEPSAQAYGYYDYFGKFHWLTFPWLNSWGGAV